VYLWSGTERWMCLLLLLLLLCCCSLYLEIRVDRGRLRLTSSNCQTLNPTSVRCKDIGGICCTSRGIIHFVLNFVAMATRVGWGEIQLAAFYGPFPKTPQQVQLESSHSPQVLPPRRSYSPGGVTIFTLPAVPICPL